MNTNDWTVPAASGVALPLRERVTTLLRSRNGVASAMTSALIAGFFVLTTPLASAASSASFQIPASSFDVAGGVSSSANHQVVSCVGSEVAGTASSANFRVDSGCGAALGFISAQEVAIAEPIPVPAPNGASLVVVAAALALLATMFLGRRPQRRRAERRSVSRRAWKRM